MQIANSEENTRQVLSKMVDDQHEFSKNVTMNMQQIQGSILEQQTALGVQLGQILTKKIDDRAQEVLSTSGNADPQLRQKIVELEQNKEVVLQVQKDVSSLNSQVSSLGLEVSQSVKMLLGHMGKVQEAMGAMVASTASPGPASGR